MTQTTVNEETAPVTNPSTASASRTARPRAATLSDDQLRELANKIYQLLRDEVRVSAQRQGR